MENSNYTDITKLEDSTIVSEIMQANEILIAGMSDEQGYSFYDKADENTELVYGRHATDKELESYDEDHLPVNFPTLYPKMQSLLGFEKQNRLQFEAEALTQEHELTAEIYNALFRSIENQDDPKKYKYSRSDAFHSATVKKFGAIEIYTEENELGENEIKLRSLPFRQICFDKNFFDIECTRMSRVQHYYDCYLDELILQYPELKDDFDKIEETIGTDVYRGIENKTKFLYGDVGYPDKKRVRIIRDWVTRTKTFYRLTDLLSGDVYEYQTKAEAKEKVKNIINDKKQKILQQKAVLSLVSLKAKEQGQQTPQLPEIPEPKEDDFTIIDFQKQCTQYSEIAGTVLLTRPYILDVEDMPVKILFSVFLDGKIVSVVDILRDLPKYFDRLMTQMDYNIGINGKSVIGMDTTKIDTSANTIGQVKQTYSEGGFVFTRGNPKEAMQPLERSAAEPTYFKMGEIVLEILEDASGGRNFQGTAEGKNQSGKAITNLLQVATIMALNIMDCLERFDTQVGKTLVKYIKTYYTHETTVKVLGQDLTEKVKQALQKYQLYEESIVNDGIGWLTVNQGQYYKERPLDSAKLNIIIKPVSARMDEKEITFNKLMMMKQAGFNITPKVLLETVDLKATMKQQILSDEEEAQKQRQEQIDLAKKQMQFQGNLKQAEEVRKGHEQLNNTENQPQQERGIVIK